MPEPMITVSRTHSADTCNVYGCREFSRFAIEISRSIMRLCDFHAAVLKDRIWTPLAVKSKKECGCDGRDATAAGIDSPSSRRSCDVVRNCYRKRDWKHMPKGVTVNGRPVYDVVYADGRRRVVRHYVKVGGHFVIDGDRPKTEEVHGRVRWIK